MATQLEKVVEQPLSLPGLERVSVARRILESVEPQAGEEVERAWEEEIVKRVERIDDGTAKFRPWKKIKKDFDSRSSEGESARSAQDDRFALQIAFGRQGPGSRLWKSASSF